MSMQSNSLPTGRGDDMNKKILLYLAIMVVGVYAMPNTVALFSGQHAFYSGAGVLCDTCHSDVLSQIQNSGYVYEKHKAAAGNTNYTTYLALGGKTYNGSAITDYNGTVWIWDGTAWQNGLQTRLVMLDTDSTPGINGDEICMLCHNATLTGSTTHTGVIVRVCDDDRCHGNRNNFYNSPQLFNKNKPNITAAGYYLSRGNVHDAFYLAAGNQSSRYTASFAFGQPGNTNESSSFISRGYWTCEGCHTGTVINADIVQAPVNNHSDPNAAKKRY